MTQEEIENNKLIASFMGWIFVENCIQKTDLYENGDNQGEEELCDLWVLNPTSEFLKIKRFGVYASQDYYNGNVPYEDWQYESGLLFHSSWDWLMPVVEKIELTKTETVVAIDVIINQKSVMIRADYNYCFEVGDGGRKSEPLLKVTCCDSRMDAVYKAVVEFIKWYNQNKK